MFYQTDFDPPSSTLTDSWFCSFYVLPLHLHPSQSDRSMPPKPKYECFICFTFTDKLIKIWYKTTIFSSPTEMVQQSPQYVRVSWYQSQTRSWSSSHSTEGTQSQETSAALDLESCVIHHNQTSFDGILTKANSFSLGCFASNIYNKVSHWKHRCVLSGHISL